MVHNPSVVDDINEHDEDRQRTAITIMNSKEMQSWLPYVHRRQLAHWSELSHRDAAKFPVFGIDQIERLDDFPSIYMCFISFCWWHNNNIDIN